MMPGCGANYESRIAEGHSLPICLPRSDKRKACQLSSPPVADSLPPEWWPCAAVYLASELKGNPVNRFGICRLLFLAEHECTREWVQWNRRFRSLAFRLAHSSARQ